MKNKTNYDKNAFVSITRKDGVHYNNGERTDYAFVFSVPGCIEKYNNKPVVGETGIHLEILLRLLGLVERKNKNKTERYKFRITNSFPFPMYGKKSQPTKSEVCNDYNLKRLVDELKDIKNIILFGEKAHYIEKILRKKIKNVKIIKTKHLSTRALNGINKDINDNKLQKGNAYNTFKRLQVIAKKIKENLNNQTTPYNNK